MKFFISVFALFLLGGCAYQTQFMARDTGKMFKGNMKSDGTGKLSMTVQLDDRSCSGTAVITSRSNTFGIAQTYGAKPVTGSFQTFGGSDAYKALLSCSDGTGLRCDMEGSTAGGGGVCVDSNNHVFDMIATPG